jgi:hypothetical protein
MGMDLNSSKHHENGVRVDYALTQCWRWPEWRMLMRLCEEEGFDVPDNWYYVDDDGPETQEECDRLANLLLAHMENHADIDAWAFDNDLDDGVTLNDIDHFVSILRRCGGFKIR